MAQQYVIDANVALGLFLRLPYSERIDQKMQEWQSHGALLFVPTLWEYECLTGLRRAVVQKLITFREAERMAEEVVGLEFHRVAPSLEIHQAALVWAERIGQSKVYDAQYLALAEVLSAEMWTADQRLFHALEGLGVNWVHVL